MTSRSHRQSARRCLSRGVLIAMSLAALAVSAAAQPPELAIVGGSGLPGGTVGVAIQLSGDDANTAVTADLDFRFPIDAVEFLPPVATSCRVAARLATTHQVAGTLIEPGVLSLALFARDLMISPLGDGELMTCDFHILPGATADRAALTIEFAGLGNARGMELDVVGVPGEIVIGTPTATPSPTAPPIRCGGDCNADATVTIEELIRGVRIVLGTLALDECAALDRSGDGVASVDELVNAVRSTLLGCPAASSG